jgi:hypothetical protein
MPDKEWIKTLEDGRRVKFIYQELPEDGAFITAQLAGNEVVYSVILTKAKNPLSREDAESHFTGELSRNEYHSFWNTIRRTAHSGYAFLRQLLNLFLACSF